jgi:hypothetical protein
MIANKKYVSFQYHPGAEFEYLCTFRDMPVGNIEDVMAMIDDQEFVKELKRYNEKNDGDYISGISKSGLRSSGMPEPNKMLAVCSFPPVEKKLNILYLKHLKDREQ